MFIWSYRSSWVSTHLHHACAGICCPSIQATLHPLVWHLSIFKPKPLQGNPIGKATQPHTLTPQKKNQTDRKTCTDIDRQTDRHGQTWTDMDNMDRHKDTHTHLASGKEPLFYCTHPKAATLCMRRSEVMEGEALPPLLKAAFANCPPKDSSAQHQ